MSTIPELPLDRMHEDDLVVQMRPALISYFKRKSGNMTEAEDLAHDVLVRALNHRSWKSLEQAKGYIFRAAVNRWRDRRRQDVTHGAVLEFDETKLSIVEEGLTPERVLVGREEITRVVRALQQLPERTREVFVLQRFEQLSYPQIAEGLGMPLSTVEKHMIRALAYLTSKRREEGGDDHG